MVKKKSNFTICDIHDFLNYWDLHNKENVSHNKYNTSIIKNTSNCFEGKLQKEQYAV